MVVSQRWGEQGIDGDLLFNECRVSVFHDEKVLEGCCPTMGMDLTLLNSTLENG